MINKPVIGVAALIFVLAAAGVYYLRSRNQPLPAAPSAPAAVAPAASEPGIAHPLPEGAGNAAAAPLPELADSDAPLRDALAQISSADAVKDFLVPQDLIRKIVVTIDNLPRQKVAVEKRPANPAAGSFLANGDELHATLDQRNFERYKPMVAVISQARRQAIGRAVHSLLSAIPAVLPKPGLSQRLFQRQAGGSHRQLAGDTGTQRTH